VTAPRLAFVISAPRSGSTLLARMLGAHPAIHTRSEPHLLTPLAHLGWYDRVDEAPYDAVQSAQALAGVIDALPGGEADYVEAVRAFADRIYAGLMHGRDEALFVDKTPAYALVLPFITRVFPDSRYIVLTRHPCAIHVSYADSFFEGDDDAALGFNPILGRYVPAIARFLREPPPGALHVRYEDLVADPDAELRRIFEHLDLPHHPAAVEYGASDQPKDDGLGDPVTVDREQRPVTSSVHRWADALAADPRREETLRAVIADLDPRDLRALGYAPDGLWDPLEAADPAAASRRRAAGSFGLQRRLLHLLRRDIQDRWHGRLLRRVRDGTDVLLRGGKRTFRDPPE